MYLNGNVNMKSLNLSQLLTQSQRALSNIHTHLSSLDRNALTQFPKAEVGFDPETRPSKLKRWKVYITVSLQKSLREVQQMLNSTESNFHQLVALLNCRGLNKVNKIRGLYS